MKFGVGQGWNDIKRGREKRALARSNTRIYPPTSVATNAHPSVEIRARTGSSVCLRDSGWKVGREGGERNLRGLII